MIGRPVPHLLGAFALGLLPQIAVADGPPREFFCREAGHFLTDAEFLDSAFAYEVTKKNLPEPFRSLGIRGMKKIDPGCCQVLREDNPFNEHRGWLERLFFDPSVLVIIGWDLDPNHGGNVGTNYDMNICGRVTERRGDFRQRDYGN